MTQAARLTLGGIHLPEDQDPLGIWELGSPQSVAFTAAPIVEGPVWQVDLPKSSREARSQLHAQRERVRRLDRELDEIAARVTRLDLVPAYGMPLDVHEAELLAALRALDSPAMAFDTRAEERMNYRAIYAECEALIAQFKTLIRPVARVETMIAGRWAGLTVIDWDGDHRTMWADGCAPDQMEIHLAAVRLAMTSRQTLLRLFVVVVTGALGLAVKAHIPGGQILLLPAVYKFVRDVLQELQNLPDGVKVR